MIKEKKCEPNSNESVQNKKDYKRKLVNWSSRSQGPLWNPEYKAIAFGVALMGTTSQQSYGNEVRLSSTQMNVRALMIHLWLV